MKKLLVLVLTAAFAATTFGAALAQAADGKKPAVKKPAKKPAKKASARRK